jgi:hypothetical protein
MAFFLPTDMIEDENGKLDEWQRDESGVSGKMNM